MKNTKNRGAFFAGQFYPAEKEELKKEIEKCFLSELGPESLPDKKNKKQISGVICPHAGYQFSGPAAAFSYKEIAESKKANTYVILGPSHSGLPSSTSYKNWETPLGISENDVEFCKNLEKFKINANEKTHSKEHSIEVQLPFLQFVHPNAKIAPIIAGHDMNYKEIALAITKTAKELKRKVIIICSSDFTHFGPAYRYTPFSENIKENMYDMDNDAIKAIKSMAPEKFIKHIQKKQATICGQMPIVVIMEALKTKKAKMLKYYTSGDILGDYKNAVGYASIVFE